MKTIEAFLSYLYSLDVMIWAEGDRLHCNAPKGTLTPALHTELAARKAEILTFLHKANLATGSTLPPILPLSRDGNLQLSFAQERLWFIDQMAPGSSTYNMLATFRLTGLLNISALKRGILEIGKRHEILRTTFSAIDGQPVQVISSDIALTLPMVDIREFSETEQEAEILRQATSEAQHSFDLAQGPLWRVKLLQLAEEEHVLLLVISHIVYDGWSHGVFLQELATLYEAFSTGKPSPLPALPIQYADFAHWQRQWLQGEVLESQLAYWKQQLGGHLPVLELPTDRPRPPIQTYRGARQPLELSKKLNEALKALSQREGVTLFMTLLAAFQTLLYRYTGLEDIIVGTPIANRNRAETEGLIGFFVNTLVMRSDLSGNLTFRELLAQVREVTLGAYANSDLPFSKLVEELQPARDLSRSPLFQVTLSFQNTPREALELEGLTLTPLKVHPGSAKFDLTVGLQETSEGLRGWFEYNTDLFEAATIARMASHFQTLLESVVANPAQRLSDLPLLTAAERSQLLVEWNNTPADYSEESCIHQLVEIQVEQTPNAVAVLSSGQSLSYQELNRRANQLAHYLRARGVGPEVCVGICLERSLEMIIGILGILKAGGAYVPLDPAYPQERLAFMLEDMQAPILLTQRRLLEELPFHAGEVVCLDSDWEFIDSECEKNLAVGVTAQNLAYVIFTSGSTGKPKGILLQHQGLCNLIQASNQLFNVRANSRVLQFASFSFDVAVWEIFMALVAGATLCLGSRRTLFSIQELRQLLREQAISMALLPPSLLTILPAEDLPALQTIISVGERCSSEIVKRWSPGRHFFNGYGPAEATVTVSAYLTSCQETYPRKGPPIGRPLANTQLYVLDRYLQPVPIGIPGELHIGGVGVARGYLNRPQLTKEKFIANPFSKEARLYKTGDLVRYLPDGNLEFLGRVDNQVKIRGFRIELGEIEAVLAQHPQVQQVVVIAREDVPGNKRLVAYVVSNQEQHPTPNVLRRYLTKKLPDYMVPAAFVQLSALPLTPNGKANRRALPEPKDIRSQLEASYVMPKTEVERLIAAVWQEMLQVEKVGIHDNFFELGGHSLLIVQVHRKVDALFEVELSIVEMFKHPTIHSLARHLSQKGNQQTHPKQSEERFEIRSARQASIRQRRQRRQKHRATKQTRNK